ncbi:unnamed protein product [Arctogadus glacialis]
MATRLSLSTATSPVTQDELLRLVTVSEKRWRARSRGDGVEGRGGEELDEDGFQSGDCDDEDECAGVSGLGPPPRRKRLRIFAAGPRFKGQPFRAEGLMGGLSLFSETDETDQGLGKVTEPSHNKVKTGAEPPPDWSCHPAHLRVDVEAHLG